MSALPHQPPLDLAPLRRPVLMATFASWNDAGHAAYGAVQHVEEAWDAEQVAEVDPEDYCAFQVTRPTVSLVDGAARRISSPIEKISVCRLPGSVRDVVLVDGLEPTCAGAASAPSCLRSVRSSAPSWS